MSHFTLVLLFLNNIFRSGLCPRQEIIDESFLAFCDRNGEDFPCSSQLLPGIRATIRCQTGFMNPKGLVNTELICEESGNWSQSAHKCEPAKETGMQPSDIQTATVSCSHQEISDISITSYCERNNADVNCTGHLAPGTKASIRCHFGYQEPRGFKSDLICQKSGNWSSKVYKCEPVCGRVARHSIPLQIGGPLNVFF